MTLLTAFPPYRQDAVDAWAARLVRTPRQAVVALAYVERQRDLMATAVVDYERMLADAPSAGTATGHMSARLVVARKELARYTARSTTLAAALKHATVCRECGRPLFDTTQPGYAAGMGYDCFKKTQRKDTPK